MPISHCESLTIRTETDIVLTRQAVRRHCVAQGFGILDITKMVTAASEIARNTLEYGGGGTVVIEDHDKGLKKGVRAIFTDHGPGIIDIDRALTDHFTTGSGMGLGLGGARRLVNEFTITSTPGVETIVSLTRWK